MMSCFILCKRFINNLLKNYYVAYGCYSAICAHSSFQGKSVLLNDHQVELNCSYMFYGLFSGTLFFPIECWDLSCYTVFSNIEIFPQVSLNFAGGASLVLRPQDYLIQQSYIVSIWALVSWGLVSGLHDFQLQRHWFQVGVSYVLLCLKIHHL